MVAASRCETPFHHNSAANGMKIQELVRPFLSPVCDSFPPAFLFYDHDLLKEDAGRWPRNELTLNLREGVPMVSVRSGFT